MSNYSRLQTRLNELLPDRFDRYEDEKVSITDILRGLVEFFPSRYFFVDTAGQLFNSIYLEQCNSKDILVTELHINLPLSHPDNNEACGAIYEILK